VGSPRRGVSGAAWRRGGIAWAWRDAADIRRDAAIAACDPRLGVRGQLDGGMAARIPALHEIGLVGIEDTGAISGGDAARSARSALQISLDRATTAATCVAMARCSSPGDARSTPPHTRPTGARHAGRRACSVGGWRRGHRDRTRPIGQRHGLLACRRVDGIERPAIAS